MLREFDSGNFSGDRRKIKKKNPGTLEEDEGAEANNSRAREEELNTDSFVCSTFFTQDLTLYLRNCHYMR